MTDRHIYTHVSGRCKLLFLYNKKFSQPIYGFDIAYLIFDINFSIFAVSYFSNNKWQFDLSYFTVYILMKRPSNILICYGRWLFILDTYSGTDYYQINVNKQRVSFQDSLLQSIQCDKMTKGQLCVKSVNSHNQYSTSYQQLKLQGVEL